MKKLIILLLTALVLSSCSANPAQQSAITTTTVKAAADTWEYEYYVEDIDYYMLKYIDATDKVIEANELMDYTALKKAYGECVKALDKFYEIVYPAPLEEKHSKFLSVIDREKRMNEILEEIYAYCVKYNSLEPELTPEEQTEIQRLQDELDRLYKESENDISMWDAKTAVLEEAYSYLGLTFEQNVTYIYEE